MKNIGKIRFSVAEKNISVKKEIGYVSDTRTEDAIVHTNLFIHSIRTVLILQSVWNLYFFLFCHRVKSFCISCEKKTLYLIPIIQGSN